MTEICNISNVFEGDYYLILDSTCQTFKSFSIGMILPPHICKDIMVHMLRIQTWSAYEGVFANNPLSVHIQTLPFECHLNFVRHQYFKLNDDEKFAILAGLV